MKLVILGDGYIGNYLSKRLVISELVKDRITSQKDVSNILDRFKDEPHGYVVINCIGKTGKPNVDWCEDNKVETAFSNVIVPLMIAEECKRRNIYWIHIGSGCIYNGYDKEWTEEDLPNFSNSFYSMTKEMSQRMLETNYDNVAILRIRMPIDEDLSDKCYISKVVKYAKKGYPIFDLKNSMTMMDDLFRVVLILSAGKVKGTFNTVNSGSMSPIDVLKLYKELREPELEWNEASYDLVRKTMKADRSNCILSNNKLKDMGFSLLDIKDSIEGVLGCEE